MPLLVLALAGCSPRVVRWGQLHESAVRDVVQDMAKLRGLPPKRPIKFRMVGGEELRKDFARDLERDADSGEMARRKRYWATLGLAPWDLDLHAHYTEVYQELPAGYYDTEKTGVRVVSRDLFRSEISELAGLITWRDKTHGETLAHEVVHALQDQHFDLDSLRAGDGSDARNAQRALVEGDAFLAAFQYDRPLVFQDIRKFTRVVRRIFRQQHGGDLTFVEATFLFPYVHGTNFAAAVFERGGWPALNAAMRDPPQSTAHILHPERYLDRAPPPPAIDLTAARTELAKSWTPAVEESVGEFPLRYLLEGPLPRRDAAELAAAWRGDRALLLDGGDGGQMGLVWVTRWADAARGAQFADAYVKRMRSMDRDEPHVGRHGQVVIVVSGLDDEQARAAEDLALRGVAAGGAAPPSPGQRAAWFPGGQAADDPVEMVRQEGVGAYGTGPSWALKAAGATLDVGGVVQYRIDTAAGRAGRQGLPRAQLGLRGALERAMELSFGLTAELLPDPDEPTLAGDSVGGRPGPSALQDGWLGMRIASAGLVDLGSFTFGRRRVPLWLGAGAPQAGALPLSRRALPFERLLPVRDMGFSYATDYSAAGIPLGMSILVGQRVQGARLSLLGPRGAAPLPRLEGGVTYAGRVPRGDGDGPLRDIVILSADLAARWRWLRVEALGLVINPGDEDPDSADADRQPQQAWSALVALQPLPDFLDLVARYERLQVADAILPFGDLTRLTYGVNLHYLPGRFLIGWDRTMDWDTTAPDRVVTDRLRVSLAF